MDGPSGVLAFDNMANRGARGTQNWTLYEIDLPVASHATNINFGALHTGDGTAWFDALTVELDGALYTNPSRFDFDFESSTPVGFSTGGNPCFLALISGRAPPPAEVSMTASRADDEAIYHAARDIPDPDRRRA